MGRWIGIAAVALPLLTPSAAPAAEPEKRFSAEELAFFEKEVNPLLKVHCLNCHGAEAKIQGGLYLTGRAEILEGGENGPAVSLAKPSESLLLRALQHQDRPKMPPKGKLPQSQIDTLTKWVKMGLPYPEQKATVRHGPPKVDAEARNFWAFRPVQRPDVPKVKDAGWVRNPIDAFVLAKLESAGFKPAPPADKVTLLRRVYYSAIGLPPSPAEVDAFLADKSADAYEKVVDRLLASRHYGEHWGRHWLDVVRYAETNSFERDGPKPNAWKYRDYVIRSFNSDKPYNRFIEEQLAGDELGPETAEGIIATGYYRLGIWDDEPADRELSYYEQLDDIVATTGQTFLGLTVNCARCHDHKIDPFPQKDYYRLLAFFHGIRGYDNGPGGQRAIGGPDRTPEQKAATAAYENKLAALDTELRAIEEKLRPKLVGGEIDDFKHIEARYRILKAHAGELVPQEEFARYAAVRKERSALVKKKPRVMETALAVVESGSKPRDTFVLGRGNPQAKGEKVEPGFPSVLTTAAPVLPPAPAGAKSSGRRKVLADWIADPKNPLTARVMVNRVWQYHFGRGIVRSSSNFGYMGNPPTHPELLDWLASEFVKPTASGGRPPLDSWSIKSLHRLILTSSAFRMSGAFNVSAAGKDPENDLLWRFDPRRLTAEEVRDSVLAASGNLNLKKTDGPSVYPTIPKEVLAGQSIPGNGWGKSTPEEAASRSVFVYAKRSLAVPMLAAFDTPDPDSPCPVRFITTQPAQALGLLNSSFMNEQAKLFAASLVKEAGAEPGARVRLALRRVTQRVPTAAEVERGVKFMAAMREAEKCSEAEALRRFCLLALNLNEFVYVD